MSESPKPYAGRAERLAEARQDEAWLRAEHRRRMRRRKIIKRKLNRAAGRLFLICVAVGASVVLAAFGGWLPGPHAIWPNIFRLYLFAVGIVAGLVIPRRGGYARQGSCLGSPSARGS